MNIAELSQAKLAEIKALPRGWYFGDGEVPSVESIRAIEELILPYALNKVGLTQWEIFPREDGNVEIHLYNGDASLEVNSHGNGTFSLVIEKPGYPRQRLKDTNIATTLSKIIDLALWSSTDFSIHTTGQPSNVAIYGAPSQSTGVVYLSFANPAQQTAQSGVMRKLAPGSTDFTRPIRRTVSRFSGSSTVKPLEEVACSTASQPVEMYAITT